MSYREVRVRAAHQTLGKRHPILTIIGPARLTIASMGLIAAIILVQWVWSSGWVSVAMWVIPSVGLVALLVWATLWWAGRT